MHIERGRIEWNLNSLIQIGGIVCTLLAVAGIWFNSQRDIEETKKWQVTHEAYHRDRLIEVQTIRGQNEERFKGLEKDSALASRVQDQLTYRLTVVEQQTANQSRTTEGLTADFNDVKSDIKVMREILQRLDKPGQTTMKSP